MAMSTRTEGVSARLSGTGVALNTFQLEAARSFALRSQLERTEAKEARRHCGIQDRLDRLLERRWATDTH
ncbi:MAG TPA: hypothetical protein VN715_02655 [Roseiarcus sp.]|nr:hypothetical protein [Roseiarcus sp.]